MTDRIAHRGPDAGGVWSHEDERVSLHLGHRRLSIIDLSTAADQPMPVQLLDAVHADGAQRLEFSISDASLRPGLLLRSDGPHAFAGVTIEGGRLVIAEMSCV